MKFLRVLLILIAVLIVGVVVLGMMGPEKFDVSRTKVMQTSPEAVYAEVADFRQWPAWSYWEKMDTTITNTFSGADSGVGAIMSWESAQGPGEMEILEATPGEYMLMEMRSPDFEPSKVEWFFREKDGATEVEWTMDSKPLPFFARAMMAMMGGQEMIENAYDEGLTALAAVAEAKPQMEEPNIDVSVEDFPGMTYIGTRRDSILLTELAGGSVHGAAMGQLMGALGGDYSKMAGAPICIAHRFEESDMSFDLEFGLQVTEAMDTPEGVTMGSMPAGKIAWTMHTGDYDSLSETWGKMGEYLAYHKMVPVGAPYEVYLTDPTSVPDTAQWQTQIVYPIQ